MRRKSPITRPATLEHATVTRSWQLNAEVLVNANILSFFVHWLKKGSDSVWSFWAVRYFVAPLALLGSALGAVFAIRQAYLKKDAHSISNAVVEVLAAGAMAVGAIAVIGSIAALAFVGPILLTAAIALKTAFSLFSAIGFAIHAAVVKAPDMKAVYWTEAKKALIDGILGAAVTAAAVTMMLVAAPVVQTALASIAIAASAFAIIHYIIKSVKAAQELKAESEALRAKEFDASTDLMVYQTIGAPHSHMGHHSHTAHTSSTLTSTAGEPLLQHIEEPTNQPAAQANTGFQP